MGNCASRRIKRITSIDSAEREEAQDRYSTVIAALAAREREITELHRRIEVAQVIANQASLFHDQTWEMEGWQRKAQSNDRILEDGTIIRPLIPPLDRGDAEAIRRLLHEFLMWDKDDMVERCRQLEKELRQSETVRRRAEEEAHGLRQDLESARARTPTPIGDVRQRVLDNIEAIRNGTWSGKADRRRNATLIKPGDPIPRGQRSAHAVSEIQPQLHDASNTFPSIPEIAPTKYVEGKRALFRQSHSDPNDSAIDIQEPCLDCEDLHAELWCLSRRIAEERASATRLHSEQVEARQDAEQRLEDERAASARQERLLNAFRRKVKKLIGQVSASQEEAAELRTRLKRYKAWIRKASLAATATGEGGNEAKAQMEVVATRKALSKAHLRLVELTASKEQAEARVLSQQRELHETRRLAMRQSRYGAGVARVGMI